ncbi:hypothetical protein DF147_35680, partial [Burkholderia cenocepacia]
MRRDGRSAGGRVGVTRPNGDCFACVILAPRIGIDPRNRNRPARRQWRTNRSTGEGSSVHPVRHLESLTQVIHESRADDGGSQEEKRDMS